VCVLGEQQTVPFVVVERTVAAGQGDGDLVRVAGTLREDAS
jgi:hypothetical protein